MAAEDYMPLGADWQNDEFLGADSAYWDEEYGKPEAWRDVMSTQNMEQTAKALLFTLRDGTQMWIPKHFCQSWSKRKVTVHIEHYDRLLAQHTGAVDLLPDLPDDEDNL